MLENAFGKYHNDMVFYAFKYLGNQKDSEDIVQEAFVKSFEMESLVFETDKALKAYLFKIVKNNCLNKIGRKDPFRYRVDALNEQVRDENHVFFDEKLLDEIRDEIAKLAPMTRQVFSAVFVEGKKYQQIADECGISINTVKTLLKNGVKKMRKHFASHEAVFFLYLLL